MLKSLPKGQFLLFDHLPHETEDADVQKLILERTGVFVPIENILTKKIDYKYVRCIVSFERQHFIDILNWAFSDDRIHGQHFHCTAPPVKRGINAAPARNS